jgi:23S rRNA pseudouridine1911/1915/1917 synthase
MAVSRTEDPDEENARRSPAIPEDHADLICLVLGPEARGQRLDRALADRLPEHSRTVVTRWIRAGRVTVDGTGLLPKHKVEGGEVVEIDVPPPEPTDLVPQDIPIDVLFEDEHLLLVNKPSGLTVHPGSGEPDGTLANALIHRFRALPDALGADRPGIVHRLDKDTSGILVVAKTDAVQRALSRAFAERRVQKTYLAVVHGATDDEGEIDAAIGRAPKHRTLMAVVEDGRSAITRYRVERRLPRHTVVALSPVTGRTHQLRVHMRHIHHPIVGDPLYGWKSGAGEELVDRLLLHAWRLAFDHPVTGERVEGTAPPPASMDRAIEALATLSA